MLEASGALIWDRDGLNWPNRDASRFVQAGPVTWHVQTIGQGPPALLVHGTGASTHSWAFLAPYLESRFTLVMVDLPGHGFSSALPQAQMSLPGITAALGALLSEMRIEPVLAVGHSAGAAILVRMALDRLIAPEMVVAINGALSPFPGAASHIFTALAKLLFLNPLTNRFFSWRAGQSGAVARLIEGTGSHIPAASMQAYERLFRSPVHIGGALAMMANWDLPGLAAALPRLEVPLLQIIGSNDRAIPPDQAFQIARRVPGATVEMLRGPGHLVHEEEPRLVAELIVKAALPQNRPHAALEQAVASEPAPSG